MAARPDPSRLPLAPEHAKSLARFLALTSAEVQEEARRRHDAHAGSIWSSLSGLMRRRGFQVVRELGVPAAAAWAAQLGLIPRVPLRDRRHALDRA